MLETKLINLFRYFGIENTDQLELLLESQRGGGSWTSERVGAQGYPDSFGFSVARAMQDGIGRRDKLNDRGYGIQHYTYIGNERILEESLKKGLFVSHRINFITDHDFTVEHSWIDCDTESVKGYLESYNWSFSPDFVRDVFKYRELISSGKLQILPGNIVSSRVTGHDTDYSRNDKSTDRVVLDIHKDVRELAVSNAISSFGNERLVEKILGHYRQNNQLANTIQMDIPWIAGVELESLIRFISDQQENVDSFQKAYHRALEESISNYRDLNFARLTNQINNDIIKPELTRITRKYERALSLHRSLSIGGAFVASMPITIALVGHIAFNQTLQAPGISSIISGFASGLVATLASNIIHYRNATAELQEEEFYVLWKLTDK